MGFENSFRFANAMSRTPRGQGSSKMNMMKTFMMMKMFSEMMDSGNGIQKRAADEDVYDLGSKLHEKLEHKKEHMEEMYGNMTCMLRECQVLDSENKFYPEGIKMEWDEMKNKIEACMRKDIKDKLEEHFGGVDKLVKETNI